MTQILSASIQHISIFDKHGKKQAEESLHSKSPQWKTFETLILMEIEERFLTKRFIFLRRSIRYHEEAKICYCLILDVAMSILCHKAVIGEMKTSAGSEDFSSELD